MSDRPFVNSLTNIEIWADTIFKTTYKETQG